MIELSSLYDGGPLLIYFPKRDVSNFLRIEEGTGDNLLREDIDEGYVDYLNWESYSVSPEDCPPEFVENGGSVTLPRKYVREMDVEDFDEEDGGMVLSRKYVREMTVDEVIRAACEECGIDESEKYHIL